MALTYTPALEGSEVCPDFTLPSVLGESFSKADFFRGKPVVFMFICNHCPYVKAIEDRLISLATDLKAFGIPVVGICSNDPLAKADDSLPALKQRAQEKNYSFPYLHDPDQKIAHLFGAVCTPDFFVYDQNQKLAYRGRLDDSWKDESKVTKRDLFEATLQLANGKKLTEPQVPSMGCSIKWSV